MKCCGQGLQGLEGLRELAHAIAYHQLDNPGYISGQMWQPSYTSTPQPLSPQLYLDDKTAALVASLLGGSVFKGTPTNLGPNAESAPLANYIRLSDGNVFLASDAVGSNPYNLPDSSSDLARVCQQEMLLSNQIPMQMDSDCAAWVSGQKSAGQIDPNAGSNFSNTVQYIPPQAPAGTVNTGLVSPGSPGYPVGTPASPIVIKAPVPVTTSAPSSPTTSGSTVFPVVSPATGEAAPVVPVNSSGAQTTDTTAPAGGAAATDWTSIFTEASFGSVPNWVWLAGAALAFMAFTGGSRR